MNLGKVQRQVAADATLEICETGSYMAGSKPVNIKRQLEAARQGSVLLSDEDLAGQAEYSEQKSQAPMLVEVTRESSLQCARRLLGEGEKTVCVLNFASGKTPGGGFKGGSLAQEESLALCSGLHPCLAQFHEVYYAPHRRDDNRGLYSNKVMYSPAVPVFREDENLELLSVPFEVSIVTVAAPHAKNAQAAGVGQTEIEQVMSERVDMALACMDKFQHCTLVLGAFGYGVFGNDPEFVSERFALGLRKRQGFTRVAFAIAERHIQGQFQSFSAALQPRGDEWRLEVREAPCRPPPRDPSLMDPPAPPASPASPHHRCIVL